MSEHRLEVRRQFIERVNAGGTLEELETLAGRIKNSNALAPSDREILAKTLKDIVKDIHGLSLPIATVRGWVGLKAPGVSDIVPLTRDEIGSVPDWAQPWAYRQDTDELFNTDKKNSISLKGFDFEFNRFITPMMQEAAGFKTASEFCREVWRTPIIDRVIYMPRAPELFEMDGERVGNSYRADLVPVGVTMAEWSEEQRAAVQLVAKHFEILVPNLEERAILICWLAHNVQRPGDKINWAPIIIGNYGDGKSVIANMLAEIMGKRNVKNIGGEVLVESAFNGWAEGSAVVAIEEVRISGHNRYEIMDKLKPLITNDRVSIHAKHRDPHTVPNTVNYLMFSNHLDAVPLDDKDRRYFVLTTPFIGKTRDDIEQAGLNSEYFSALFNAVQTHYAAIRGWLEAIPLELFNAKGNAPASNAKAHIVELCRSDEDLAINDILDDGAIGVTKHLFSASALVDAVAKLGGSVPRTQTLNRVLSQLGYRQIHDRQFWDGKKHRVWVSGKHKKDPSKDEIRRVLDETRY